jgi:hypothetical protein
MPEKDTHESSRQDFGLEWPEWVADPLGDAQRLNEQVREGNVRLVTENAVLRRRLRLVIYYAAAVTALLVFAAGLLLSWMS